MRFKEVGICYHDIKTGLKWSLKNYDDMTWQEAVELCRRLNNGWRIPTIEELFSLIDFTRYGPATTLPNMVASRYWSSSASIYDSDYMWGAHFAYGEIYYSNKADYCYVRYIQGNPTIAYQDYLDELKEGQELWER